MALVIKCHGCDKELDQPGGLLFGSVNDTNRCTKLHLCVKCTVKVLSFIHDILRGDGEQLK